jgi:outer membrane protein TolC
MRIPRLWRMLPIVVAAFGWTLDGRCAQPATGGQPLPMPSAGKASGQGLLRQGMDKGQDLEPSVLKEHFNTEMMPVDLATVLKLAGVNNLEILLARQRVTKALAERQYAAAQLLPSVHLGTSFDDHAGNLQQSNGNILQVDRNSVYFGAGAYAIGAGTVVIPGIGWNLNLSDTVYKALISRQFVEQARFANRAVENDMLRKTALAYTALLRAEGWRALTLKIRGEARQMAYITSIWAKAGAGREADKDRAASELAHREADVLQTEGEVAQASARLAELLNLDPSTRLHVREDRVVPAGVVPEPIPLPDLIAIAMLNRPELQEHRAAVQSALLAVGAAKMLPFSPNLIVNLSYGGEAGGSNLAHQGIGTSPFAAGAPRFGLAAERLDFDAVAFWTLQNLGVGNRATIRAAQSNLKTANLEFLAKLDMVRAEVARAHAATHVRFAQIKTAEEAVKAITSGYALDYQAIVGNLGRPIELLDSLRLLGRSRLELLDAIIRYNQAQLELYVALGQPPADVLAREVPPGYGPRSTRVESGKWSVGGQP